MKRIDFTQKELESLHWVILAKFSEDELGRKMASDNIDGFEMSRAHEKIKYAIVRPDRTGQSVAALEARMTVFGFKD